RARRTLLATPRRVDAARREVGSKGNQRTRRHSGTSAGAAHHGRQRSSRSRHPHCPAAGGQPRGRRGDWPSHVERLARGRTRVLGSPPSSGDDLAVCFRSEEHTSELQSRFDLVCRLLLEKKKINKKLIITSTLSIYSFVTIV